MVTCGHDDGFQYICGILPVDEVGRGDSRWQDCCCAPRCQQRLNHAKVHSVQAWLAYTEGRHSKQRAAARAVQAWRGRTLASCFNDWQFECEHAAKADDQLLLTTVRLRR